LHERIDIRGAFCPGLRDERAALGSFRRVPRGNITVDQRIGERVVGSELGGSHGVSPFEEGSFASAVMIDCAGWLHLRRRRGWCRLRVR
jgi:hypothetical protein